MLSTFSSEALITRFSTLNIRTICSVALLLAGCFYSALECSVSIGMMFLGFRILFLNIPCELGRKGLLQRDFSLDLAEA